MQNKTKSRANSFAAICWFNLTNTTWILSATLATSFSKLFWSIFIRYHIKHFNTRYIAFLSDVKKSFFLFILLQTYLTQSNALPCFCDPDLLMILDDQFSEISRFHCPYIQHAAKSKPNMTLSSFSVVIKIYYHNIDIIVSISLIYCYETLFGFQNSDIVFKISYCWYCCGLSKLAQYSRGRTSALGHIRDPITENQAIASQTNIIFLWDILPPEHPIFESPYPTTLHRVLLLLFQGCACRNAQADPLFQPTHVSMNYLNILTSSFLPDLVFLDTWYFDEVHLFDSFHFLTPISSLSLCTIRLYLHPKPRYSEGPPHLPWTVSFSPSTHLFNSWTQSYIEQQLLNSTHFLQIKRYS